METLAAALNLYDDETASHARRVTDLALRTMRRHDPSLAEDPALPYAFLLHDIGKMGIPDSILRKPGPPSRREQLIVRRHTLLGERLLALAPSVPSLVHDVVAYHHERWDGTGYPYGLRGEEIPPAARIFAVADAYDALTNDRPYRAAVSVSEAVTEVRASAGTQFDPDVVETFVGAFPRLAEVSRAVEDAPALPRTRSRDRLRSDFLTNESLVLLCIAEDRDVRVRDIATRIGLTERGTHAVLGDLVRGGFVERTRVGRRNRYRLVHSARLGNGFGPTVTVGDLIATLLPLSSVDLR
jgi:HD domain